MQATSVTTYVKLSNQFFSSVNNFAKLIMKEEGLQLTTESLIEQTRAVEEAFVSGYKNLPELWDTSHKHYTNKYKRIEALDILLQIMKRWNPFANRSHVRRKINIIRSTYRKDKRKYLASKYIGQNGDEIYEYEPRNWKFHALKFLEKNDSHEIAEINMDDNNFEDETSNGSTSETGEPLTHGSDVLASETEDEPPRKKNRANQKSNKFVRLEIKDDYYEQNNDLLDRELEAIGANVTCKLKRMNSLQRYHAELLINKVLITGLKNNLSDETDLTDA